MVEKVTPQATTPARNTRSAYGDARSGGGRRRHMFTGQDGSDQYAHEVLDVARVVRVVKGGRRFRFRATVIVGDRAGRVGFGTGKSRDVQQAVQKAQDQAMKNIIEVPLQEGTIAHVAEAHYKGSHIMLKPARPGTGVIAGGTVRVVADMAGIRDLVSKSYGSSNRISNVLATLKALQSVGARRVLRTGEVE